MPRPLKSWEMVERPGGGPARPAVLEEEQGFRVSACLVTDAALSRQSCVRLTLGSES